MVASESRRYYRVDRLVVWLSPWHELMDSDVGPNTQAELNLLLSRKAWFCDLILNPR